MFERGEKLSGQRRQEIHCHECDRYVQFTLDFDMDGNHVLECPNCGHEHCRVVIAGRITNDRWASQNRGVALTTYNITASATTTCASVMFTCASDSTALGELWMGTSTI